MKMEANELCVTIDDVIGLPVGIALVVCRALNEEMGVRIYDTSKHGKRIELCKLGRVLNNPVKKAKENKESFFLYV